MKQLTIFLLPGIFLAISSCKKDPAFVDNNQPPDYSSVPTVLIENYVNRIYIDLIGREPLDAEMEAEVNYLKSQVLSAASRLSIITKLQSDTSWIAGDSSYKFAYYYRFYQSVKAKMLEGVSDGDLWQQVGIMQFAITVDSLNGDSIAIAIHRLEKEKLENVLEIQQDYFEDSVDLSEIFFRCCNNSIYDQINMNTFNFVNATFDNLFYRFPTDNELYTGMTMVDENIPGIILGESGENKGDYLEILTNSREFYEGMINWVYLSLVARAAGTDEVDALMETFYYDHNFQKLQQAVMVTDEYANF